MQNGLSFRKILSIVFVLLFILMTCSNSRPAEKFVPFTREEQEEIKRQLSEKRKSIAQNINPDEPMGFRGIIWGDDLSKKPDMIQTGLFNRLYHQEWAQSWTRKNEKMNIGEIECKSIKYLSFGDNFYGVDITIDSRNSLLIIDALEKLYGFPAEKIDALTAFDLLYIYSIFKWETKNTSCLVIEFKKTTEPHVSLVSLSHEPLRLALLEFQCQCFNEKRRRQIEEVLKDF